ncbi:MAG: bifunctional riboflavin kinase/FAD synthetase [Pseudomonadota bacterium]
MTLIHAPLSCDLREEHRGSFAVMGNFDGVHRGHQSLIETAKTTAAALGKPLSAVVFEPHPRRFFKPDEPSFLLSPLDAKTELLARFGVEKVFALPFGEDLRAQTPEDFVRKILHQVLGLTGVATGQDFQFGAGRSGSSETLATIAGTLGMRYQAIAPIGDTKEKFSSSQARQALREGKIARATEVLGYPWFVDGTIVEGRRLARTLGFPTANVTLGDVLRPLYGVYAVRAEIDGNSYGGVANIGVRPTVDGKEERLEVHLFDFDGDLYGKNVRTSFVGFIREERAMDGLDALKAQIAKDSDSARALLAV